MSRVLLQKYSPSIFFNPKINKGDLISTNGDEITLKKGHTYNVTITGSLGVSSNTSDGKGYYCIQMTDSTKNADLCREITRIGRYGSSAKIPYNINNYSFNYNRVYDASAADVKLRFLFEQSTYNTVLDDFNGTITITALD